MISAKIEIYPSFGRIFAILRFQCGISVQRIQIVIDNIADILLSLLNCTSLGTTNIVNSTIRLGQWWRFVRAHSQVIAIWCWCYQFTTSIQRYVSVNTMIDSICEMKRTKKKAWGFKFGVYWERDWKLIGYFVCLHLFLTQSARVNRWINVKIDDDSWIDCCCRRSDMNRSRRDVFNVWV